MGYGSTASPKLGMGYGSTASPRLGMGYGSTASPMLGMAMAPGLPQDGGWAMCGMGVWDREGPRRMYVWAGVGIGKARRPMYFWAEASPQ